MRRQLVGRLATRCETFACVLTVTPLELVIMPMISTASRRQARSNLNTFFPIKSGHGQNLCPTQRQRYSLDMEVVQG